MADLNKTCPGGKPKEKLATGKEQGEKKNKTENCKRTCKSQTLG